MNAETKRLAKALFGRAVRPLLAQWILARGGEVFYLLEAQTAMSAAHSEPASAVKKEIDGFVECGLLARVDFESDRRVYFQAIESPFWAAFEAIALALGRFDEGASERSPASSEA